MDDFKAAGQRYVDEILSQRSELSDYLDQATILLNVYANNQVWDIMILMDDDWFSYEFAHLYSEHFVVDDHDHVPPVFTRVKNWQWLRGDFARRRPTALWIFQNSLILRENGTTFQDIVSEQQKEFHKQLKCLIRRKYLELRTDRHGLRFRSVQENIPNALLKANVVKVCFELLLLAEGKPYPFKAPLAEYARQQSEVGDKVFQLATEFLATNDPKTTISLSDQLIEMVSSVLLSRKLCTDRLLEQWWLFLD